MPIIPQGQVGSQIPRFKGRTKKKIYRQVEEVASKTFGSSSQISNYEKFFNAFLADQEAYRNYLDTLPHSTRYQLERDADGSYTLKEWETLCVNADFRCLCCGREDVKLTVDHVIPLSKGGSHWIRNIQPLCGSCNSRKGVKETDYRAK